MNLKRKKNIRLPALLFALCTILSCRPAPEKSSFDIASVKSYRDIPGVTESEISAIEELKSKRQYFSYGVTFSTEAFKLPDGIYAGFTPSLCEFLSDLFGIPFVIKFHDRDALINGVEDETIDFTGELATEYARKQNYFVTDPIAGRSLSIFTYGRRADIEAEKDIGGLKLGFYENAGIAESILKMYPLLEFESVAVYGPDDIVEKLVSGIIDAYVDDSITAYDFMDNPSVSIKEFFPLFYVPVSMVTANHELAPVLSVIDRYLAAGGAARLDDLYKEGNFKFAVYRLFRSFSSEEKGYLDKLAAEGSKIPIALENNNYPISFYNQNEGVYQGIAPDILSEISRLTGLRFNVISSMDMSWETMLNKLKTGEVSLVSESKFSREVHSDFLWTSAPYAISRYALLSKVDYPYLEMYQAAQARIGVVRRTIHEEIYNKWFYDNPNTKYYNTKAEAFYALDMGLIDLLMDSENGFHFHSNSFQNSGYKVNILFSMPVMESYFGLNSAEGILRSVIDKAQSCVNVDNIGRAWENYIFNYYKEMAIARPDLVSESSAILLLALIILIILLFRDNQTKLQLENQMITLSAIYKSLPDLVFCKDVNGRYTSCNSLYEVLAGESEAELIGKTPNEVKAFNKDIAYRFNEVDGKVLSEKRTITTERWLTYPDGSVRLVETVKAPLIQNNKVTGLLGITRDITEHREALEAAKAASKAKSNFLAKMSHEIRTPMNAVIGMAELALYEKDMEAVRKHIFTIKQAGANLLSIINDILDFSKIESGRLEINQDYYLFASMANDVISIIRMRAMDSQLRFVVNIDSNIPKELYGDVTRIRQVLINILSNGVKYTKEGFVSFTVIGNYISNEMINLTIEIMDSGQGIKKEDIKNLFNDFTRLDISQNRSVEGAGLGLAITRNIVKAMNGDIQVFSEYGKGSSFTITLPQKFRSAEKLALVENPQEKKVIVFERRDIFANSIVYTIDNLGVVCTHAADEAEFQRKLSSDNYAFIFIASTLYERNKDLVLRYATSSKIILLAEFGEVVFSTGLTILAMPVNPISVANTLNGVSDSLTYNEDGDVFASFTAPDARVLVVDDIKTNLTVIKGLLMPYNMNVELCKSGSEAINAVQSSRYDLIFMDHWMPEMDGVEATLRIRELGGEDDYCAKVPIIALTANAISEIQDMFMEKGFSGFLAKPIDTVKLNSILEKWIPVEKRKMLIQAEGSIKEKKEQERSIGIFKMKGVDVNKGIMSTGGSMDNYLETLEVFYEDGINKIRELTESLDAGNINFYTIQVHALKSASASIGAMELSNAAKDLEMAGKQKDTEYIEKHNGAFILDLKSLLNSINNVLPVQRDSCKGNGVSVDRDALISKLVELKTALEEFDAGKMHKTIEDIQKFDLADEIIAAVRNISNNILIAEYDEALTQTEILIKG